MKLEGLEISEREESALRRCCICLEEEGEIISLHGRFDHLTHLDCLSFFLQLKHENYIPKCPVCLSDIEINESFSSFLDDPEYKFLAICRYGSSYDVKSFLKTHKLLQVIIESGMVASTCGQNIEVLEYLLDRFGSSFNVKSVCLKSSVGLVNYELINIWLRSFGRNVLATYLTCLIPSMNLEILEYFLVINDFTPADEYNFLPCLLSEAPTERIIAYLKVRDKFISKYGKGINKSEEFYKNWKLVIHLAIINERLEVLMHITSMKKNLKYFRGIPIVLAHFLGFSEFLNHLFEKKLKLPTKSTKFNIASAVSDGNLLEIRRKARARELSPKHIFLAFAIALKRRNLAMIDCLKESGNPINWQLVYRFLAEIDTDFVQKLGRRDFSFLRIMYSCGVKCGLLDVVMTYLDTYKIISENSADRLKQFTLNMELAILQSVADRKISYFQYFYRELIFSGN